MYACEELKEVVVAFRGTEQVRLSVDQQQQRHAHVLHQGGGVIFVHSLEHLIASWMLVSHCTHSHMGLPSSLDCCYGR